VTFNYQEKSKRIGVVTLRLLVISVTHGGRLLKAKQRRNPHAGTNLAGDWFYTCNLECHGLVLQVLVLLPAQCTLVALEPLAFTG
jgi:hypothetical protein